MNMNVREKYLYILCQFFRAIVSQLLSDQAQLGRDPLKKLRTISNWDRSVRPGSNEEAGSRIRRRPIGKAGSAWAGRPLVRYFVREYIWELVWGLIYEHWSARQYFCQSVWTCIKLLFEHILCTKRYYFELSFCVFMLSLTLPRNSMF